MKFSQIIGLVDKLFDEKDLSKLTCKPKAKPLQQFVEFRCVEYHDGLMRFEEIFKAIVETSEGVYTDTILSKELKLFLNGR